MSMRTYCITECLDLKKQHKGLFDGSMGHSMGHGSMGQWVMGHKRHRSPMLTHGPLCCTAAILDFCHVIITIKVSNHFR